MREQVLLTKEKEAEVANREEELTVHLEKGKGHFEKGDFIQALTEFQKVLEVAPGNLTARIWIHKAKENLKTPKIEAVTEEGSAPAEVKRKECLWMKMGIVSFRLCTRDYDCLSCEFDQMMQGGGAAESPEVAAAIERLKALPGNQRFCRYALRGEVSHRLCTLLYQCVICEFSQIMEEAFVQKMAKLEARREALRKKEERAKAKV